MNSKARSFFERLTGSVPAEDFEAEMFGNEKTPPAAHAAQANASPLPQEDDAQLVIDVFQTNDEIILQAMVAGVRSEDLDISITQDMVTINGKRTRAHTVSEENFYYHELYWGGFSRSILLPQEIDAEEAQAIMKNGLLTIRLPKLDKTKVQKLRVKSE